jgi:flagellar basal-body rod modification protein FlgD
MNVMTRMRSTGLLQPNKQQRAAVREELWANTRARLLGHQKARPTEAAASPGAGPAARTGAAKNASAAASEGSGRVVGDDLGQDAFLQLLVQQMQMQDPLEPISNEDMIANLAQFSSLEQMENLNDSFEAFTETVSQQHVVSASNLIGRDVTGQTLEGQLVEGTVDRVFSDGGAVYLAVGEQVVPLPSVFEVT